METSYSLMSSSAFPSSFGFLPLQKTKLHHDHHKRRTPVLIGFSRKRDAYDRDSDGRLVDENMVVLRKRIHEMKVAEGSYEAPSEWMEWEKRCYHASYGSDVSELVGMLQAFLLSTRPGLAFGLVAIITVAVPASVIVMVFHLLVAAMSVLARSGAS
ncbi:uncharacterized protein [Elaeis guineensis]|uniref:Uncharacterized protein LOC105041165 n=1 Tax=Elaeis guineensis var. tenera TaxID=51953 RepID=A0A6I9QXZ2_ELAGV|nr:uncharacterized protein LOC105041165 [Elaeis guineensis]